MHPFRDRELSERIRRALGAFLARPHFCHLSTQYSSPATCRMRSRPVRTNS
jgi:hypothetical protein